MKLILEVDGTYYPVSVSAEEKVYTVELPNGTFTLDVTRTNSGHGLSLLNAGDSYEAWAVRSGNGYRVQVMGSSYDVEVEDALRAHLKRLEAEQGGTKQDVVKAPMPGVVVEIKAQEGDTVEAGQPIIIVEAMKMRNEFSSKISGVIRKIHVVPGQSVERHTELCVVVPAEEP